jgi:mannose-6-phosphate isomerase-like protein (cupin superfamily)
MASRQVWDAAQMNLSTIDTNDIAAKAAEPWLSSILTTISGVNLRFRVMQDTQAQWHVHSHSPECFFVLDGQVTIETALGGHTLGPGEFFRVEPGITHRARVMGRARLLVLDQLTDQPQSDTVR